MKIEDDDVTHSTSTHSHSTASQLQLTDDSVIRVRELRIESRMSNGDRWCENH